MNDTKQKRGRRNGGAHETKHQTVWGPGGEVMTLLIDNCAAELGCDRCPVLNDCNMILGSQDYHPVLSRKSGVDIGLVRLVQKFLGLKAMAKDMIEYERKFA